MKRALVAVVSLLVLSSSIVACNAVRNPDDAYRLSAVVEQAPNLFEGGRVMVRGVQVGTIEDVEPDEDGVRLSLVIDDNVKVPADAELTVIPITVISDRYVQLSPPYAGGAVMEDGDAIPVERTNIPAELEDVLAQLQGLLDALEADPGERTGPLARLVTALDASLKGHDKSLGGTLRGSAAVLQNLADADAELRELVTNLDTFFLALAQRSSEIGLLNERFALVAQSLRSDKSDIEGTIENLTLLSDEADQLVGDSGRVLADDLDRLSRVLDVLLEHRQDLHDGARWSVVIARALGATDAAGRGINAYSGRVTAPGSPGAEYNYRIDTRDTLACRRLEALVASLTAFNPDATTIGLRDAALSFMAPEYQDDLEYLVGLLIPKCGIYLNNPDPDMRPLQARARQAVATLESQVGKTTLRELLERWLETPR